MKKGSALLGWVGICLLLALVSIYGFEARGSAQPAGTARADIIAIDVLSRFGELEEPPVEFFHDKHTEAVEKMGKDCAACHLEDPQTGRMSIAFKRLGDTSRGQVKDIYHDQCIACHEETAAAGQKSGPEAAAVYTGRESTTDEGRFYFNWEYLNESMKKTMPDRADQVSWFLVEVARPELAPVVAAQIDALFKNSLAETITETEAAFFQGFVAMTEAILLAIQVVSWLVIGVILVVLANTMAMSARERLREYAVLKTMGFRPRHLAGLIFGESLLLALMGGLLGLSLTFPAVHLFKTQMSQYFRVFPLTRLTLALGLGTALAVGILAALAPAWRASRVGIAAALRKVG